MGEIVSKINTNMVLDKLNLDEVSRKKITDIIEKIKSLLEEIQKLSPTIFEELKKSYPQIQQINEIIVPIFTKLNQYISNLKIIGIVLFLILIAILILVSLNLYYTRKMISN